MTGQPRPDGRILRGDANDTLHADDPHLLDWLRRILKPEVFYGDAVVMPGEAMNGLASMARDRGFIIEAQDG